MSLLQPNHLTLSHNRQSSPLRLPNKVLDHKLYIIMSAEAEETGYGTNEDFSSPSSEHERGGPTPVLQRAQTTSTIISLLLSPVAIILVSMWASALGGVSWT